MDAKHAESEVQHGVDMFKKYKNLLGELTRKTIKLKYRNSWLGIFWSFLQPLLNMIVLSVVFSGIFGRDNRKVVCYPVYLFAGRLLYEFFVVSTKQAMTSFRRNAAIIKKVYVPKYMYPFSSILSSFVTTAISMLCYIMVWIFFKATGIAGGANLTISWHLILFLVPLAIILVFSTGVGMVLSVLCVYFRDIEYIWDVLTKLLFYTVPIIYHISAITSPNLKLIIRANPLYHLIEMFRQCVLYGELLNPKMLIYSIAWAVVAFIIGAIIFDWKSDDLIYHL
ncbi:MAG: ABC transporter permease [Eubacterium sp.]|nr:ABC transporter permease [Eubacterium sp.]